MNAVRITYEKPPREVRIPEAFRMRPLEIIFMALGDDETVPRHEPGPSRLAAYAGKWQGGLWCVNPRGNTKKDWNLSDVSSGHQRVDQIPESW